MLRLIDLAGRPVAGAQAIARDSSRMFDTTPVRSDADGKCVVGGLSLEFGTVIDISCVGRSLGATIEIPDSGSGAANNREIEVRLAPLVSLSGRVLDETGKPIDRPTVNLFRNVNYAGASGRSFGALIASLNELKADGTYTFENLIPGASYNTQVECGGYPNATSAHLTLKLDPPFTLADFRLPIADQEASGIVVDPRGKPLADFVVSYEQANARRTTLYVPSGGVWWQTTGSSGKFHLTSLPRGPIKLMAYRRQDGAGRQIEGIRHVDVTPGQDSIQIAMPDENDRLRGID